MTARASFDPWAELARIRAQKMPLPQLVQCAGVTAPSGGTDVPEEATFATFATFASGDGETRAIFERPRVPAVAPAFIAAYTKAPQRKGAVHVRVFTIPPRVALRVAGGAGESRQRCVRP